MSKWNGRSPPVQETNPASDALRVQLRRVTFRRRYERPGSDRRMNERRQPASHLASVPGWLLEVPPPATVPGALG